VSIVVGDTSGEDVRRLLVVTVTAALAIGGRAQSVSGQAAKTENSSSSDKQPRIEVRISTEKTRFLPGEEVPIRFGTAGNEASSSPSRLRHT
jgi:hypothetical protein